MSKYHIEMTVVKRMTVDAPGGIIEAFDHVKEEMRKIGVGHVIDVKIQEL